MSIVTYILTSWLVGYLLGINNISALVIIAIGSMIPTMIDSRMSNASKFGFSHSFIAVLLLYLSSMVFPFMQYIAIGACASVMLDFFGRRPVQLFWPLKKRLSIPVVLKGRPSELIYTAVVLVILFGVFMDVDTVLEMVKTTIEFFGFFFHQIVNAFVSIISWIVDAISPGY